MRSPILSLAMGAVSGSALALMLRYQTRPVFFVVLGLWLMAILVAHWYVVHFFAVRPEPLLIIVTALSLTGMVSLVEWVFLRRGLVLFGTLLFAALFAAMLAPSEGAIHIAQKPIRRFLVLLWVFDAYAVAVTAFAVGVFFQDIPFWAIILPTAAIMSVIAYEIWSLYYTFPTRWGWIMWGAILFLIMFELFFVLKLLPFGYTASGLLAAWVWYILQLFIRFHLSSVGILWHKQWRFLVGNGVLFIVILIFVIKWV